MNSYFDFYLGIHLEVQVGLALYRLHSTFTATPPTQHWQCRQRCWGGLLSQRLSIPRKFSLKKAGSGPITVRFTVTWWHTPLVRGPGFLEYQMGPSVWTSPYMCPAAWLRVRNVPVMISGEKPNGHCKQFEMLDARIEGLFLPCIYAMKGLIFANEIRFFLFEVYLSRRLT